MECEHSNLSHLCLPLCKVSKRGIGEDSNSHKNQQKSQFLQEFQIEAKRETKKHHELLYTSPQLEIHAIHPLIASQNYICL